MQGFILAQLIEQSPRAILLERIKIGEVDRPHDKTPRIVRTQTKVTVGAGAPIGKGLAEIGSISAVANQRKDTGRYDRRVSHANASEHHTLQETERAVAEHLEGLPVDMASMAAVQNVYRAANAFRNHLERTVLAPHDLTWTGWVVLWVVWIWDELETRHAAAEAAISKGTLTGVVGTLESRGLVRRRTHPEDARRVLLSLTPSGRRLMTSVFPEFNAEESRLMAAISDRQKGDLARSLRTVVNSLDEE